MFKKPFQSADITKNEVKFVVVTSIFVLILSLTPFMVGYLFTPDNKEYTWLIPYSNVNDINAYIAWMRQGSEGYLLFEEKYTSEQQDRVFFMPLLLGLGLLSSLFGIDLRLMFHISRMLFGFLLLLVSYLFIAYFLKDRVKRKIAFLLVCFSAGFGAYVAPLGFDTSTDIWMPESIVFRIILENPLFVVSTILLLSCFYLFFHSIYTKNLRPSIICGFLVLLLGFIHIYDLITFFTVGILFLAYLFITHRKIPWLEVKAFLIPVFFSLTPLIYNFAIFTGYPAFESWAKSNLLPSPSPVFYITGFGLILILAAYQILRVIRYKDETLMPLVIWAIAAFILVYSPITIQRKLIMGVHVPLCILAAVALYDLLIAIKKRFALRNIWFLFIVILVLSSATNFGVIGFSINILQSETRVQYPSNLTGYKNFLAKEGTPLYLDQEFMQAFDWLNTNTDHSHAVFSSYTVGYFIPAYSGNRAYIGKEHETIDFWKKFNSLLVFFNESTTDDYRIELLENYNIQYVLYSPFERSIGEFNPDGVMYLDLVYKNDLVKIFKVYEV